MSSNWGWDCMGIAGLVKDYLIATRFVKGMLDCVCQSSWLLLLQLQSSSYINEPDVRGWAWIVWYMRFSIPWPSRTATVTVIAWGFRIGLGFGGFCYDDVSLDCNWMGLCGLFQDYGDVMESDQDCKTELDCSRIWELAQNSLDHLAFASISLHSTNFGAIWSITLKSNYN